MLCKWLGWWIAPLAIFLIKRESRFASFHALQALLLQIVYMVFMAGFMVLWFGSFFLMIARHAAEKSTSLPAAFFSLSSNDRFVIAFRSPDGFVETGLRVPPPEKKATKLGFGVRRGSFSSPI
jgi:uncharacterized membrane protein